MKGWFLLIAVLKDENPLSRFDGQVDEIREACAPAG